MNVVIESNVKKLLNPQRYAGDIIFHGTAVPQICTVWYSTLTGFIEYPKVDQDRAYSSVKLMWCQNDLLWWFRDGNPSAERRMISGGEHVVSEPFGSQPGDKVIEQSINEVNSQYQALKKAESAGEMKAGLKEPWEMTFSEFLDEYERVMKAVAVEEKKGGLDPAYPANYKQLTSEEQVLLEKDWKAFSRSRGFSEEDIIEYERWFTLSGQRDKLPGCINDPWRRGRAQYARYIYLKHVEYALAANKRVPDKVIQEYERMKGERLIFGKR